MMRMGKRSLASELVTDQSDSSVMSLEAKLMSGELTAHLAVAAKLHSRLERCSRLHRFRQLVVRLFRLSLCSYPIWSDAH